MGTAPDDLSFDLQNSSLDTIHSSKNTINRNIKIVGGISRSWALRYWLKNLLVSAPLTIFISGILSYLLFVNCVK